MRREAGSVVTASIAPPPCCAETIPNDGSKSAGVLRAGIWLCVAASLGIASLHSFAGVGQQEAAGLRLEQALVLTLLSLLALGFALYRFTRRVRGPSPVAIETDREAANSAPSTRSPSAIQTRSIAPPEALIHTTHRVQAEAEVQRQTNEFLIELVHELRDPLNGILGFAQLLESDANIDPKAHDHAVWIRRSGEHLLALVNDILEIARIDAGHLEIVSEIWETAPFFEDLCFLAGSRAKRKGILFRYEPAGTLPPKLIGDSRRLRQVALNLLGNAAKFTAQGEVILRCGVSGGRLWIEVQDTGVGIAPEDLAEIFKPFGQVGESSYKSLGTGLGLALARRLTEAMGGTLEVASTLGVGSSFRMEVAVGRPPELSRSEDPGQVTGYRRNRGEGAFRVLVVDDEPVSRMLLSGLLGPLGFVVVEVNDGQSCLDLVPSLAPDLILMDYQMPGLSGLETVRQLHTLCANRPIPVILISGGEWPETQAAPPGADYAARLGKPFHLKDLLDVIATQLPLEWQYRPAAEPALHVTLH